MSDSSISGAKLNETFKVSEICGANFCPGTKFSAVSNSLDRSTVNTLMGIYLAFGVLAILVVLIFLDKMEIRSDNEGEIIGRVNSFWALKMTK